MRRWGVLAVAAVAVCIAAPVTDAFHGSFGAYISTMRYKETAKALNHRSFPLPLRRRLNGGAKLGALNSFASASVAAPAAPVEKFRKDYKPPDYSIRTVDLTFKIYKGQTQVGD